MAFTYSASPYNRGVQAVFYCNGFLKKPQEIFCNSPFRGSIDSAGDFALRWSTSKRTSNGFYSRLAISQNVTKF